MSSADTHLGSKKMSEIPSAPVRLWKLSVVVPSGTSGNVNRPEIIITVFGRTSDPLGETETVRL